MAKEEKLFTVRTKMNDGDYEDVYRVFMDYERGHEKKYALIICLVLCALCIVLLIFLKNITFLFYGIGCLIIGAAYSLVPVNKKFLASNKLQFGEWREMTFYPHALTVMEYLEDEDTSELSEEEMESAITEVSTGSIKAYETNRGFVFADGKITNLFFYVAKRGQPAETVEAIRSFAQEKCSGGYILFESAAMVADETEESDESSDNSELTDDIASQFYGASKLHLYDDDGNRIREDDETAAEDVPAADAQQAEHTMQIDEPELDVDAEWEKIIAEEDADEPDE
ncbi:MAG TPA: hypothetical protein DDX71_02345 [Ruminococcus sp.]|nr:hypothetical protein [Ruminococcus sp.]